MGIPDLKKNARRDAFFLLFFHPFWGLACLIDEAGVLAPGSYETNRQWKIIKIYIEG